MITRHSVLLVEMLFLDSMLIIKIVTNLAWEPISQQQYISPRNTLPGTGSFWLILYWSYLKDVCLGKGSNGICTALKCCFLSIQAASWRVHNAWLQLVRQALCYLLLSAFWWRLTLSFTVIKLCYTKLLSDWDCVFWVPEWNFLLQRPQILTLFTISSQLLNVKRSLYILHSSPLLDVWFADIFCQFLSCFLVCSGYCNKIWEIG